MSSSENGQVDSRSASVEPAGSWPVQLLGACSITGPMEIEVGRRTFPFSKFRSLLAHALIGSLLVAGAGCEREKRDFRVLEGETMKPRQLSSLVVGGAAPSVPVRKYEQNAYDISQGKQLFSWLNCSGCHAKGGGGMGPALMDDKWIYGASIDNIAASITEGRPAGMPAFRNRATSAQIWQLAAYVRALGAQVPSAAAPGRDDGLSSHEPESRFPTVQPLTGSSSTSR
jgi:cytochrome c oxidase cbb3-type subunit 3